MSTEERPVAVLMRKERLDNRWQTHRFVPLSVQSWPSAEASCKEVRNTHACLDRLHTGYVVGLYADEAEGYYLNVSSPEPSAFVAWRPSEDGEAAAPVQVTLSYNEAARWMDGSERVDRVPLTPELFAWVGGWVEAHYRPPEKKQRIRPQSFESREGRFRNRIDE